ncbi:hypothetical protein BGW42_006691 [Actinomortierella wolfii]|nr:hypothetical protein BGW42_006691 [Actinomortierella wolfii]
MNQLMNDLFGDDSDTESLNSNGLEGTDVNDAVFQSIMNATAEDTPKSLSSFVATNPCIHETFQHVPGLSLHHNVLAHEDQSRLIELITEANYFKGGELNQSMCFGESNLSWLRWVEPLLLRTGTLSGLPGHWPGT